MAIIATAPARTLTQALYGALGQTFGQYNSNFVEYPIIQAAVVNGCPGIVANMQEGGPPENLFGYGLPDYLGPSEINVTDLYRMIGAQFRYTMAWNNNGANPILMADMSALFEAHLLTAIVDFVDTFTNAEADILCADLIETDSVAYAMLNAAIRITGLRFQFVHQVYIQFHSGPSDDDWGNRRIDGEADPALVGPYGSTGAIDVVQALEDIAHTRMDFQMNNGGPSWSLTGGARIDGAGGGG